MKPGDLSRAKRVWPVVALIVLVAGGLLLWRMTMPPPVPELSFSGDIDPVVQQAVEAARRDVVKKPKSDRNWGVLGMVLAAHHALEPASRCFARAEALNPEQPRWPYYLSLTIADEQPAMAALERAAAIDAREPLPKLALGEKLLARGQTDAAGQQFQSVLDADPTEPRALTGMANIALSRGDIEGAQAALLKAAARAPQVRERLQLLAQVLNRLGRRDEAIATQRQAEASIHSWPDPYFLETLPYEVGAAEMRSRIDGLTRAGMRDQALAVAARAIELHPDNAGLHLQHGRLVAQLGRYTEAEASWRRALELGADEGEPHFMLGHSLYWQRRFDEAESAFRDALEREPDNPGANLMLAMTLEETGDKGAAARYYQIVLETDPDNEEALRRLEALRASLSGTSATTDRD